MKLRFRYLFTAGMVVAAPFMAFAASKTLADLIDLIIGYLNKAMILLMGFAMLMFVWYVIQYYIKPNDDRAQAGSYVLYSVIGFFIIFSLWGLVNILSKTFGLQNNTPTVDQMKGLFPGGGSSSLNGSQSSTCASGNPLDCVNSTNN